MLRRCTLVLSDPAQNHRLPALNAAYDILAIRPTDEKSLQQACHSLECDIISLDLTVRLGYHFKFKQMSEAIDRGIRVTRGRGLIISSEAGQALGCRGPSDVINLASVWGLGQERGKEAVCQEARATVVAAHLRRTSFRGVMDVVDGGRNPGHAMDDRRVSTEAQKKRKLNKGSENSEA